MALVAALVKYNPCVIHARRGVACPVFGTRKRRQCIVPLSSCSAPEYDGWFKDVLAGKTKFFYPRKMRLLEIPGTFLLVYHTHKRAIVGEAEIRKATSKGSEYRYWFEDFVLYPKPVRPEILQEDPRLAKIPRRGIWSVIYISEKALEEIRSFSRLGVRSLARMQRKAKLAEQEVEKSGFSLKLHGAFSVLKERERLSKLGVKAEVLDKAEKMFLEASKSKVAKGRSKEVVFYASLYLAHRDCRIPTKPRLIQKLADAELRAFKSTLKLFLIKFRSKRPPFDPREWIAYYSSKLKVQKETVRVSLELIASIKPKNPLKYKSPSMLAAAALYLACLRTSQNVTEKDIATTFEVSEAALRNLVQSWQA